MRAVSLTIVATLFTLLAGSLVAAQETPVRVVVHPGQSDADIGRIIGAATQSGREVLVEWRDVEDAALPATDVAPPMTEATEPALGSLGDAFMRGAWLALDGLSGIAGLGGNIIAMLAAEGRSPFSLIGIAGMAIAVGVLAAALFRRIVTHRPTRHQEDPHVFSKVRAAFRRLVGDLFSTGLLAACGYSLPNLLLEAGTLSLQLTRALVTIAVVMALYASFGRFLLASLPNGRPLIDIAHPRWHLAMLIAYGAIGSFTGETVRFANARGMDKGAIEGWFLICTTVLTVLKLWWFIGGAKDIRDVFTGSSPGIVRRMVGYVLPEFYALSALLIWLAGFLMAGRPESAAWSFAAGTTQIVLVVVPAAAFGMWAMMGQLAGSRQASGATDMVTALLWGARTATSGAVWLVGLHLIVSLWQPLMSGQLTVVTWPLLWLERISLAIVVSWTVCTLVWRYFEAVAPAPVITLPGQEDGEVENKQASRLSTVMPVVRNLTLGAVLAIAGLVVLSSIGVDVAPLLAGFGVLGLALSFGSQTLVKDIVSGIFFIADDAFRVGEYIDSGKLKGTVERINLRSIRLRHHNGPVHTIPFGQIGSVTNYSRDWGTTKFELRFDRDADAEIIRKTAKKIGLAMLDDPEFANEFLVPLKMQGIQDITETSMVVRFKFTSKPGNPSLLKREGMKKLLVALKAAGVQLASNAVTVREGMGFPAAAAAETMLKATKETGLEPGTAQ